MEALGINIVNLIINLVLFTVFYLILGKLVLKKLGEVLKNRENLLAEGIDNTSKSKSVLADAVKESQGEKSKAQKQAEEIIEEAKRRAESERKKVIAEAEAEATLIREKANSLLATHKQKLENEFEARLQASVKSSIEKLFKEDPNFKL